MRQKDDEFHTPLYFLCILLHQQGHFASAVDMRIWEVPLASPLVEVLPGDEMASKHTKEANAGAKLRAKRAKLHNALSMVARLQGEELAARKGRVLIVFGNPVERAYRQDRTNMTTDVECLQRYCAYARCGQTHKLHMLRSQFLSIERLQQMGFDVGDGSTADYKE